jgi:predicted RNA-binding Zn-ribbon protein involved in translation (DUF1610 family)
MIDRNIFDLKGKPTKERCPRCGKGRITTLKDRRLEEQGYRHLCCNNCGWQWGQKIN